MAESKLRRAWKNEYIQTGIMIVIIVVVIFGLWFGSQIVLRTPYPALAVASGSMCKPYYMRCDGWSHPFERTLHTGDLIIVQGIDGKDVKTGWDPEGDIIIFHRPKGSEMDVDELIVHRAIANLTYNGLIYFETRGDGSYTDSGDHWTDYRGENYTYQGYVSEKLLVGKVIMRIPWLGHISQYMRNSSAIYIIIILLVLLVIVEFVFPILTHKKPEKETAEEKPPSPEKPPEA
jgi:hypothetical protein